MNTNLAEEIKTDKAATAPNLHLITGGIGGDGPWLKQLPEGTEFLCRPKRQGMEKQGYIFVSFGVMKHFNKTTYLVNTLDRQVVPVDPVGFSNAMDLWEILPKEEPVQEENNNKDKNYVEDYRPD